MRKIPEKTIQRLIIYRKILNDLRYYGETSLFSSKLAQIAGYSPVQVRSDLMVIGYQGTPARGYDIDDLETSIGSFIDAPKGEGIAIVGIGSLGKSMFEYCYWKCPNLSSILLFDVDSVLIGSKVEGTEIHHINDIDKVQEMEKTRVAIITVPPENAQDVTDMLILAGIKGILNYTPVRLKVPDDVFVEEMDMIVPLEKVAFYARQS